VFESRELLTYTNPNLTDLDDSEVISVQPNLTREKYCEVANCAISHLVAGDSYELNLTFDAEVEAYGDPFLLYQKLKRKQRTRCSTYFYSNDRYTLSFSPEIFWNIKNQNIRTFPMKGTSKRRPSFFEDQIASTTLKTSEKERAENVMITDLFRNDLGKISQIGSVKVKSLFQTEAFESVWQMTSEIDGVILPGVSFRSLLTNLFPSGSVTGAPKIRSMEILSDLEQRNRGLYTGSIFTLFKEADQMNSDASVAIRTLQLNKKDKRLFGTYAVGSGITVLANPESEYEECLSKLTFLTSTDIPDFEILETIRFFSGRFRLLSYHLERMKRSCERLGFPFNESKAMETLDAISHVASGLLRIRLLVNKKGDFRAESFDFIRTNKKRKINLSYSKSTLDSEEKFLYHKTTIRHFYIKELELGSKEGSEDVILLDENGNISETCLRNLFFKQDGQWFTPSLNKGGLAGTLRQKLLDKKWIKIQDINPTELSKVDQVLVGNSLRGLERVNIHEL
jgi:para-aminobenzoate synthetase/4-amino-4-deoxychorismate lyase